MNVEFTPKCDNCRRDDTTIIYTSTLKSGLDESDFTVFGELGEYPQIVRCNHCDLIYAYPRDDGNALEEKYKDLPVLEYLEEVESRQLISKKDAQLVESYCKKGRILDIGCSAGIFLSQLKPHFEKFGIEPSVHAAREAQRIVSDGQIYNSLFQETSLEGKSFNVITMWDVIEHLDSPSKVLSQLHNLLADKGYLILVTPNISGLMSRIMGKRWPHLIRGHIYYFSPKTIRIALERAGYEVLSIKGYTRYFKISYILKRVGIIKTSRSWPTCLSGVDITVPVNLDDAMCVVARKV
tara:strand:- start:558 stop:1442 length:885 start_codon:yes stop_codon:yes gene_type:complete